MSLALIVECYESDVDQLPQTHTELGGGAARAASGLVYENLIERTVKNWVWMRARMITNALKRLMVLA